MFVKILILIITITLIANEFYHFLDKLSSKIRKIILFSIIGFLTLLSLIDIYNDEEEANQLKEKTDAILIKAEEINELQGENNTNIIESKKEIVGIGSLLNIVSDTLGSQVVLLGKAVSKSKELVSLENKKFALKIPKLYIPAPQIIFTESVLSDEKYDIKFNLYNYGEREAIEIDCKILALISLDNFSTYEEKYIGAVLNEKSFLPSTKNAVRNMVFNSGIPKSLIETKKANIALMCRITYKDIATLELFDKNLFYFSVRTNKEDVTFSEANADKKSGIINHVKRKNIQSMLSKKATQ